MLTTKRNVHYASIRSLGLAFSGSFWPGAAPLGAMATIGRNQLKSWTAIPLTLALLAHVTLTVSAATLCVDLNSTNPVSPYDGWATAATNIQDAIDAAGVGDTVLVTNGIYATGGKVMAGDLTNRVAVNKALTVQSVNGPGVTVIQGAYSPSTGYGPSAVRCAWLTNGAALVGFTLLDGATRSSGDQTNLQSGAGVWCTSSNVCVANCIIISNKAAYSGGGSYQGSLTNCLLTGNYALYGGGAYYALLASCRAITNTAVVGGAALGGTLRTCLVVSNSAPTGGGVRSSTLYNCTVTGNSGGGVDLSTLTNCLVYFNTGSIGNYSSSTLRYSCSTPLPTGTGNIASDPQLCGDGCHLGSGSPCRGAGTNSVVSGLDIDGQPWANPPSIGCDEWQPAPIIAVQPRFLLSPYPAGFTINLSMAGGDPFVCWWSRNGVPIDDGAQYSSAHTTNLTCTAVNELVGGGYEVVISNAYGMATSVVAQAAVHCVDATGTNPVPPYATWATAATNIQDAITAALPGEPVLVNNGIYASGGKSMDGVITNRVTLDKAIMVESLNGPSGTFIEGNWGTNGPAAVRCAWLTNGAVLSGFTLRGGATRAFAGSYNQTVYGGGIWGSWGLSNKPMVFNCMIVSNLASGGAGGAYQVILNNCTLAGNQAISSSISYPAGGGGGAVCYLTNCVITGNAANLGSGGGTASCSLRNCAVINNSSYQRGAGASDGPLVNCTVSGNICGAYMGYGGAVANANLTNCVVYGNFIQGTGSAQTNCYNCTLVYSDSDPLPAGVGNINLDPQLLPDGFHIATSSPCRGAGTNVVVGTDIDGQAWANPPAMGCDEWQPAALIAGQPQFQVVPSTRVLSFSGGAAGQAPFTWFWSKDGTPIQDGPHYSSSSTSNLVVNQLDASDAGTYQFVISNAFNMATSAVAQVVIHCADAAGTNPASPYATWSAAATTIQEAVNAAGAGDIVLVTDGVYARGGKAMYSSLTNRVALDKALLVMSMNGYASTIIQGASGAAVNGPAAVRCAWLTNGATLAGFTLQGGATFQYPAASQSDLNCGGGAWCATNSALVENCLIRSNTASYRGSAIYQGTINDCAINNNVMTPPIGVSNGGAVYSASVNNCTVVHNSLLGSYGYGGGLSGCAAKNSIIWGNTAQNNPNCYLGTATNCDTTPTVSGAGNISSDPQFVNDWHIFTTSPCRGAGGAAYATGVDIDGEAWSTPPSIGCDEPLESGLVGPLSVNLPVTIYYLLYKSDPGPEWPNHWPGGTVGVGLR
jgi:hypothetical protein